MKRTLALRTTMLALSVALAVPACRSAKDNNPPGAIRNTPSMVEPARDVMADPAPKTAEKVAAKTEVVEPPRDVLAAIPQPVKEGETKKVVPKKAPVLWKAPDSWTPKSKIEVELKRTPPEKFPLHQ